MTRPARLGQQFRSRFCQVREDDGCKQQHQNPLEHQHGVSSWVRALALYVFPGLTLGEHANGPRAHSVAIQGFQFEYRAPEALARWR
jgi:hypothetical protein